MQRTLPYSAWLLFVASATVHSSPWLEADDAYLRSDLQLLSDAGLITAPINHYPLRWSAFSDELKAINLEALSESEKQAYYHLRHALSNAELNRGNKRFKAVYGNRIPLDSGYGNSNKDEWGLYSSYEHLDDDFSFRLSSNYSKQLDKHTEDTEQLNWDGSYLTLNAGSWLLTVGALDRWWGQGWQHNLTLSQTSRPLPSLGASYQGGDNIFLGYWNVETFIAKLDSRTSDSQWSSRLVARPLNILSLGISYQAWSDTNRFRDGEQQLSGDVRVSLPSITLSSESKIYHGVYGEFASTDKSSELGARLIGWDGQWSFSRQSLRLALEKQTITDEWQLNQWPNAGAQYPANHSGKSSNSYLFGNSVSASLYLQFSNDHNLSLIGANYEENVITGVSEYDVLQANYTMPFQQGKLNFGIGKVSALKESNSQFWIGYDLRF
nr:capsule assembly Wzi family protein [Vibrio sp. Of7-15]